MVSNKIKINKLHAKSISYGGKRNLSDVKFCVIHYTGNDGDTAENNAKYFATSNTREAGAHYFVDKEGEIWESIGASLIAYAVGGLYTTKNGAGSYHGKCTNTNSISIELCDCIDGVGWKQMLAVRQLVKHLQKKCPNMTKIIRHWDVNGKECPKPMVGNNNKKWKHLYNKIQYNYQFKAKVTRKAYIRSTGKATTNNKIGVRKKGDVVCISKVVGKWGRLKDKKMGKWQWISLRKIKEI